MSIEVTLNSLTFDIPTSGEHSWSDLTDWILEVNETLNTTSTATLIPAGTANLTNGVAVNLYSVATPSTNSHLILEYGISRVTTGVGAMNVSETGTMTLAYSTDGKWRIMTNSIGDASVVLSISSSDVIQATPTALTGDLSSSVISYSGRIIAI